MTTEEIPLTGGGRTAVSRIGEAANEAVQAGLTMEISDRVEALWAMAWRARSAAWMGRHRGVLEAVLT